MRTQIDYLFATAVAAVPGIVLPRGLSASNRWSSSETYRDLAGIILCDRAVLQRAKKPKLADSARPIAKDHTNRGGPSSPDL